MKAKERYSQADMKRNSPVKSVIENTVHNKPLFSQNQSSEKIFFNFINNVNYVSYHINFFALFTRKLRVKFVVIF